MNGRSGETLTDLDGCDSYLHVADEEELVVEAGFDCIEDGGQVVVYDSFEFSADGSRLLGVAWLGATSLRGHFEPG